MRWSIIICTHNRSVYLAENLPKVLELEYSPEKFEVIVVDNASTDNTSSVAKEAGVRCVREGILGLTHARNRGIAESRGDLIAFVDDDAWPETNWLHELDRVLACIETPPFSSMWWRSSFSPFPAC